MNPMEYREYVEQMKLCVKCNTRKPISEMHRGRTCKKCDNKRPRSVTLDRVSGQRARSRAHARLADAHPEEYQRFLAEELANAKAEAASLGYSEPHAALHVAVPVQLKSGPRMLGEAATDRIREDVGKCLLCINRHDRDHVCPACGSRPQVIKAGR
jgi:Zn finger protein HypA/HybF involved in hydrogenase expression